MLGMLAEGRGCFELPDYGVLASDEDAGTCVCEFERYFDVGPSKVSYHLCKLEEAGLCMKSGVASGASTHSIGRPQDNTSPRPLPIWMAAQAKTADRCPGT